MTRRHPLAPLLALALAGLAAFAAAPAGAAAPLPCQVPETDRHTIARINLDGDPAAELVDVFNFDAADSPVTELMVCNVVRGDLVRASLRVIWGPSPGSRTSGLRAAWIGNLDRSDSRVEVAARNFITPSAGEDLVILRQSRRGALTFSRLQTISADTVTMLRPKRRAAEVKAFVKATHAIDGKAHTERWLYSQSRRRWVCASDCFGRPTYTMAPCAGEVPGPLDTAAVDIRVLGMSCARAKTVIAAWLARPRSPVSGFTITSPQRFRGLGRNGGQAFWFALRGTD